MTTYFVQKDKSQDSLLRHFVIAYKSPTFLLISCICVCTALCIFVFTMLYKLSMLTFLLYLQCSRQFFHTVLAWKSTSLKGYFHEAVVS